MNGIVIGFVILGIMTVAVLIFIITNAPKAAQRAREKREAEAQAQAAGPPAAKPDQPGRGEA